MPPALATTAQEYAEETQVLIDSLGSVYSYKGSILTYADLTAIDTSTLTRGDTYNVVPDESTGTSGMNYSWTGESWDTLGSVVELSGYSTTDEMKIYVKGLGYATSIELMTGCMP